MHPLRSELEQLIHAGLSILPLRGKAPDPVLAPRGVYSATRDRALVRTWLAQRRNLGATTPDGSILHLDIDPRNGGNMQSLQLTKSWAYLTGRGDGGAHVFYRMPAGFVFCGTLEPGVDVLGIGKQGVIPPSIHPDTGQPYRWAKGCSPLDIELADCPEHLLWRMRKLASPDAAEAEEEPADVEEVISALAWIDPSDYSIWRNVGFALKRSFGDVMGWRIFDAWSNGAPNYREALNRQQWAAFERGRALQRRRIGIGSVFFYARQHGWPGWHPEMPECSDEQVQEYQQYHRDATP